MSNEIQNEDVDKPEPIYGPITNTTPIYDRMANGDVENVETNDEKTVWWKRILSPTFRIWAYGVASAAVVAGAIWAGQPEFAATAAPLIMAIFFVDRNGQPK